MKQDRRYSDPKARQKLVNVVCEQPLKQMSHVIHKIIGSDRIITMKQEKLQEKTITYKKLLGSSKIYSMFLKIILLSE